MTVIPFPVDRPRRATDLSAPAVILVLPVIRIERFDDADFEDDEELISEPVEALCRSHVDRLREAVKGLPRALDGDGGPV